MTQTPTPWAAAVSGQGAGNGFIDDGDGLLIVRPDGWGSRHESHEETIANARRIVAAVNGTSAFSTEALEQGVIQELVTAMDRAWEALDIAANILEGQNLGGAATIRSAATETRAALEKVRPK